MSVELNNTVSLSCQKLRHFLVRGNWQVDGVLGASSSSDVGMWSNKAFSILIALIIDNSGHRKSGNLTAGVGRQYMGEIGKTDNGIITVTAHLYDGLKSLPLDIALYQKADSLP